MKVFILYDSKYGNTKVAAENILEGLKMVQGIEIDIGYIKDVVPQSIICSDALILGGPNHMASPSRTMKKFVDKLASLDLKAKSVAIFGTYSGRTRVADRAVKKMEKVMGKMSPNLKLLSLSLSIKVKGVTGPIAEGELPKCKEFGRRIASQLMSG